jgi:hemerythrin-like domain-containing protein
MWDSHEERESEFFNHLYKLGFTIPIKKLNFEHGKLRRDMEIILDVMHRGKEEEMHTILDKYGKDLIRNLRKHMSDEDWILYALPDKYKT